MKKKIVLAVLVASMAGSMLAGCGNSKDAAVAASTEAVETADTESTEEISEEEYEEEFIPADFVQEQAGVDSFDSYDDVLSYLDGETDGFAYISLDGSTEYVLAVTNTRYSEGDEDGLGKDVSLYAYNESGKLVNVGNAFSDGGEDDPIRCEDGVLYVGGADEYGEMKISTDTNGLFYTKNITRYSAEDGTNTFAGFVRDNDDINASSEDIGISTDEEFDSLLATRREKTPIKFWGAEYTSYGNLIAQLPSGYGHTYLTIDGYDGDVLAVTDYTYQWDNGENASLTAYLYAQNGDTVQYLGSVMTGGTGYPIRCENGILYNCNMVQYGEMKVMQKEDGKYALAYTSRGTIKNNANGVSEVETEGDMLGAQEAEIREKIAGMEDVAVVDFDVVS